MGHERIKPVIVKLEKCFDETTCTYFWSVIIDFFEEPDLKLGTCEVIQ